MKNTVLVYNQHENTLFDVSCLRWGVLPTFLDEHRKSIFDKLYHYFNDSGNNVSGDDTEDNEVILLLNAKNMLITKPLTSLFEFYRKNLCERRDKPFIYAASACTTTGDVYNNLSNIMWNGGTEHVIDDACIITTKRVLIDITLSSLMKNTLDLQSVINQYLKQAPETDLVLDENRRFLVWPRFRVDIGSRVNVSDAKKLIYGPYEPYIVHRHGNGNLMRLARDLGYDVTNLSTSSLYKSYSDLVHYVKAKLPV